VEKLANKRRSLLLSCLLLPLAMTAARADSLAPVAPQNSILADSICSAAALGGLSGELAEAMKAPAASVPVPLPPASGIPVVITVPGLKFSKLGWGPLDMSLFVPLVDAVFPQKNAADAADKTAGTAAVQAAFNEYNRQFEFLQEAADRVNAGEEGEKAVTPGTYLEDRLRSEPACANFTIIPFTWSRDTGDTQETVQSFIPQLAQVYDTYKNTGRPIYILAHSWGAVLMHDVMQKLSRSRPDVKIDKFVTIGSPLIPGNVVIGLFKALKVRRADLEKNVTKPANLRYWKNVWGSRDPFSNSVGAADDNVQIDASVEAPEGRLLALILTNSGRRLEAKDDLMKVINVYLWHKAYYRDYKAYLKTIDQSIDIQVFGPHVAPAFSAGSSQDND